MTNEQLVILSNKVVEAKGKELQEIAAELGMVGVSRAKVNELRAMVMEELTNRMKGELTDEGKQAIIDAANQAKVGAPLGTNDGTEESDESSEEEDEFEDEKSASEKVAESEASQEQARSDEEAAKAVAGKKSGKAKKTNGQKYQESLEEQAILGEIRDLVEPMEGTKAEIIRQALKAGFERKHIAKAMEIRYQQVFQIEKQMKDREAKAAAQVKVEDAE